MLKLLNILIDLIFNSNINNVIYLKSIILYKLNLLFVRVISKD